jgi:hypothetical protein
MLNEAGVCKGRKYNLVIPKERIKIVEEESSEELS